MKKNTSIENKALKVLILEDTLQDMELMVEQLSKAGYQLDVTHAEEKAGFREALKNQKYEIILSDFKLPGFDAFGALEISQEICPEVPFICVSGLIGEELAIELLKKGAVDYVLKDRPERLPYAVQYALEKAMEKAARKQAENELLLSKLMWEDTFDAISDIVCVISIEHEFIAINAAGVQSLKLPRSEIVGKKCFELVHGTKAPLAVCPCDKSLKSGVEGFSEYEQDGKHFFLFAWPIKDGSGNITSFVHIIKDNTERKKTEQALIAKMDELERFHKLTVGREINMVELKKEVNNLLKKLGEDPKYKIVE